MSKYVKAFIEGNNLHAARSDRARAQSVEDLFPHQYVLTGRSPPQDSSANVKDLVLERLSFFFRKHVGNVGVDTDGLWQLCQKLCNGLALAGQEEDKGADRVEIVGHDSNDELRRKDE